MKFLALVLIIVSMLLCKAFGQQHSVSGRVVDAKNNTPIEFAIVVITNNELWAISDDKGLFSISKVPQGNKKLKVKILGYVEKTINVEVLDNIDNLTIKLEADNLSIEEVVVTAQREDEITTSYKINSKALEHEQIMNISDIQSLLPGGKTINDDNFATSAQRFSLRSESKEKGNASFGTAVEVDGVRLQNNASFGESYGVDTRNVATANIESVEVITGIPSAEYGDLSNGIVKINTKKGLTPLTAIVTINPNTKQIGINKGFSLGSNLGIVNASAERTKSISDITSPHTSYDRNALGLNYFKAFENRLTLTAGISLNIGGYNTKADPDEFVNTYTKQKDNNFRANIKADWFLNKSWITNLDMSGSVNYSNKFREQNENKSSSSSQAAIHSTENGYFIATDYDENPDAPITLMPTGYWYLFSYYDNRLIDYSAKLRADQVRKFGLHTNKILFGIDYNNSGNLGRGEYYDDMRYAPTWREYVLSNMPHINNMAVYLEDKLNREINSSSNITVSAGLRSDNTYIDKSEYGWTSNISPRINAKYSKRLENNVFLQSFNVYGGWGKSVKLPSSQILYPEPSYSDILAFTPSSTSDNIAYYAYYTLQNEPIYNPSLKWQSSNQFEIGFGAKLKIADVKISAFRNKTVNPYISETIYLPYTYKRTTQEAIENSLIPSDDRQYTIDQSTGIVSIHDASGKISSYELEYKQVNMFQARRRYTNGSPSTRMGLDWIVDFAQIPAIKTSLRIDGNYYYYKGIEENITAWKPSFSQIMANGEQYKFIGYYAGTSATNITSSSASVANGSISKQVNNNLTVITHIPKIRMIVTLRLETSLYNYKQNLSEYSNGDRGFILEDGAEGFTGDNADIYNKGKYVAVYPLYYTTWEDPDTKIPFKEKYLWAKENDSFLYNELSKLVMKSNTSYYFNAKKISAYYSANINITKEIRDIASISFFARNFTHNMGKIKSSDNNTESSLFDSSYVPKFYYGLSMRLKF